MNLVDIRPSSTCSIRSGYQSQSRGGHVSGSRDKMTGSAKHVQEAVETTVDGFANISKSNRHRFLCLKLNLDMKPVLRAPVYSRIEKERLNNGKDSELPKCRPVSAPSSSKRRQFLTRSARDRTRQVRTPTPDENGFKEVADDNIKEMFDIMKASKEAKSFQDDTKLFQNLKKYLEEIADYKEMFDIVKAAKEAKSFQEDINLFQNLEKSLTNPDSDEKKDAAPVFNKRLFVSQGTVIMTEEARRLMAINSRANLSCDMDTLLSKRELQCLRCVTEGLKLIHKGHDFVKDVLSRVVTFEIYKSFQYVQHKPWEDALSCYYILNGAVEVTYDLRSRESRNVYQANIIYSHGTGEYLGLVSPEGPPEDLAPPATIYTKELTQFIRVDRQRFHKLMEKATAIVDKQKRDYLQTRSFLAKVSDKVKEKLLHKFTIQEFAPNRVLLTQGDVTEFLFVIMSGRCQTYREVYIPEADKEVLFYLTSRDTDDFFGEECVLDLEPSYCTVVAATTTVGLKLHRSALKMVNRDKLRKFIETERHEFITDQELRDMGYKDCVWNKFKHGQIKETLKEGGKLCYLSKEKCMAVLERPPDDDKIYTENKRRFVLKGSQFDPVRTQSAIVRGSQQATFPVRPHTVLGNHVPEETENDEKDEKENEKDTEEIDGTFTDNKPSSLMTAARAKEMNKHLDKAMESKEALMKLLEEHGDMGLHLKQAWRAENAQETQNFMKNGVLVTMTSEDIVRKAKALADSYADKWKKKSSENDEEEWNTILHAENKQAKMLITANRLRLKDLKRRMTELQKRRDREREKRTPRKPDPQTSHAENATDDRIESEDEINGAIENEEEHTNELKSDNREDVNNDNPIKDDSKQSEAETEDVTNDNETGDKNRQVEHDDKIGHVEHNDKNRQVEHDGISESERLDSQRSDTDIESPGDTSGESESHGGSPRVNIDLDKSVISSRPDSAIGSMASVDTV